ncbi:hypothetical protein [Herbiconiux sp. L3-i23]|uniref:hypothetical protein n=1 Tax=Herbiconiux sp. L3-i23 TaxID=2905871 RepID=UPI00206B066C|nr:hypothetical protein [Herbiconiux sp. L3-i23]BDI22147.1 hypothetical protein L3i23_09230 [Herbiconiux sp. L3-i23]
MTTADSPALTSPRKKSPLGLVAFIVAVAAVLIGTILSLTQAAVVGSGNYQIIGVFSGLQTLASGVLGFGATVLGVIALLLRGTSKPLAAAATALGASILLGALTGLLYGVVVGISTSL